MFDDLFFEQIGKNLFFFPILISIAIGFFMRNVLIVLLLVIPFAFVCDVYADGGRIIVQSMVVAAIAHSIGGLTGFLISKLVR